MEIPPDESVQTNIPARFLADAGALPPALRALLEAELAAGNTIVEVGSSFPAPPAGAFFKMTGPVTTRPRETSGGLTFREFPNWSSGGAFTDDRGFYFILEPALPPPPEPDMDAIRAAHAPRLSAPAPFHSDPNTALGRFERSMAIDYEKWHDGEGYDLDAIAAATPQERAAIQKLLLQRGTRDWRDVEALAALNSPVARTELKAALEHSDARIRLAAARSAPELVTESQRVMSLVKALDTANWEGGLSQALDEAAEFHPEPVIESLLRGVLQRDGETAVNFAAMLLFVHDKADGPFDWDQRPFLLRFNTPDRGERQAAFAELCGKIGVDPN
jgi:hypothetical protein